MNGYHRSPHAPRGFNDHAERGIYGSRPHVKPFPKSAGITQFLTLVTWGNTIDQCQRAAHALAAAGIEIDLLDLRSLSPWDEQTVIASAERTGRLIIVHEDNHTCGFGAEVAATVAKKAAAHVKIRRVTRPETPDDPTISVIRATRSGPVDDRLLVSPHCAPAPQNT